MNNLIINEQAITDEVNMKVDSLYNFIKDSQRLKDLIPKVIPKIEDACDICLSGLSLTYEMFEDEDGMRELIGRIPYPLTDAMIFNPFLSKEGCDIFFEDDTITFALETQLDFEWLKENV